MSNVVSIAKKSIRTEAILSTSVDPATFLAEDGSLEALAQALTEWEKADASSSHLAELISVVKKLNQTLKKSSVRHAFARKDLVIWIILELLDTDVGLDEMMHWLRHRPTLDEIVFADDASSILSLLGLKDQDIALKRYQHLQKSILG